MAKLSLGFVGFLQRKLIMKVECVFGSPVVTHHCSDTEIYKNEIFYNKLLESLRIAYELEVFLNMSVAERNGKAVSTVGSPIPDYLKPHFIQNNEKLFDWLYAKFMESAHHYVNFKPTDLQIVRCWANMMYKGSSGKIHNHYENSTHCVGVFYVNCPANSADIVFVKEKHGDDVNAYSKKNLQPITPQSGDLIIHDPIMNHGVSEHKNDEPRVCIIIDVHYVQ